MTLFSTTSFVWLTHLFFSFSYLLYNSRILLITSYIRKTYKNNNYNNIKKKTLQNEQKFATAITLQTIQYNIYSTSLPSLSFHIFTSPKSTKLTFIPVITYPQFPISFTVPQTFPLINLTSWFSPIATPFLLSLSCSLSQFVKLLFTKHQHLSVHSSFPFILSFSFVFSCFFHQSIWYISL